MRKVQIKILLPDCVYQMGIWIVLSYRRLRYGEAFRLIPLTKGLVAIVSPEDYDRLAKYNWYASKSRRTWYAQREVRLNVGPKKQRHIAMHREVMSLPAVTKIEPSIGEIINVPDARLVDHQNHNGLDNRRSNLRIATITENGWNKRKTTAFSTSRFKGVSWDKRESRWRVQGRLNGRQSIIGFFDNEEDAARAYDAWAITAFGRYAALNFPQHKTDPLSDWSFKICYGNYTG